MASITWASLACKASEPLLIAWVAVWLAAERRLPGWSAPFWPPRLRLSSAWMASDSEAKPEAVSPPVARSMALVSAVLSLVNCCRTKSRVLMTTTA